MFVSIINQYVIVNILKEGSNDFIVLEENDRVFDDTIWHDVVLIYENEAVHLMVDDQKYSTATSASIDSLELYDTVCFGGLPHTQSFMGSLGSVVEVNGEILDIVTDSVSGMNIGNPDPDSTCDPYLCNSNGNCLETSDNEQGFICNCYYGFQGMHCESGS